jgi:hypothetical protein
MTPEEAQSQFKDIVKKHRISDDDGVMLEAARLQTLWNYEGVAQTERAAWRSASDVLRESVQNVISVYGKDWRRTIQHRDPMMAFHINSAQKEVVNTRKVFEDVIRLSDLYKTLM